MNPSSALNCKSNLTSTLLRSTQNDTFVRPNIHAIRGGIRNRQALKKTAVQDDLQTKQKGGKFKKYVVWEWI